MWQRKHILITEMADRWSSEITVLSKRDVWERLWSAFWTGAFDDDGAWGFERHDAENSGVFVEMNRRSLAHSLFDELIRHDLIPFSEAIADDQTKWRNLHPAQLEMTYEKLSHWGQSDYDKIGKKRRAVLIDDAAVKIEALISWCKKTKTPAPSFLVAADPIEPQLTENSGTRSVMNEKRPPIMNQPAHSPRQIAPTAEVEKWVELNARGEQGSSPPSAERLWKAAQDHFQERVTRRQIRELRDRLIPPDQRKRGRRPRNLATTTNSAA